MTKKWEAYVYKSYMNLDQKKGSKKRVLGYFAREEDAAKAADKGRIQNVRWLNYHHEQLCDIASVSVSWYDNQFKACMLCHACLLQIITVSMEDLVPHNVLCGVLDRVRRL